MTAVPFSLLLPVYAGDRADFFARAFSSSVTEQTRPPAEVVIVEDGPIPGDLEEAIAHAAAGRVPVVRAPLAVNGGLARALEHGLEACAHDVVARIDADDISLPERFARQLPLIEAGADLVGAGMLEFEEENGAIVGRRVPPTGAEAIARYARFHDPFSHPTVVYRREAVRAAGGYQPLGRMEDYWLFARMIDSGARVANVPDPLVMYRVGAGAYARRGGRAQWRSEMMLQRAFRGIGFTSRWQRMRNTAVRGAYRFVPESVRRRAYRRFIAAGGHN